MREYHLFENIGMGFTLLFSAALDLLGFLACDDVVGGASLSTESGGLLASSMARGSLDEGSSGGS